MKTAADLRAEAARQLGVTFNTPADLTPGRREELYDTMVNIALSAPQDYPQNVIAWANARKSGGFYGVPLEEYSLRDAARDFTGEVVNQAVDIHDAANPFSEANRGKLFGIGAAVVVVLVLLYAAPVIVPRVRQALKS